MGGKVYVKSSILARDNGFGDCWGSYLSEGYNLIQDSTTSSCGIAGGTTGNIIGTAPFLASLADNAGPTLTHLLLEASPAIDVAIPALHGTGANAWVVADQRDVIRPQDGDGNATARGDMDAVEIEPPPLYPDLALTKHDSDAEVAPGDTISCTLSIANNGAGDAFWVVVKETV